MQTESIATRSSNWLAYAAPFAAFMVASTVESSLRAQVPGPWAYVAVYGGKLFLVAALLWWFRSAYPRFTLRDSHLGLVAGAIGAIAWIYLCQASWARSLTDWIPNWLMAEKRAGFNPFDEIEQPGLRWATLALRFVGLVIVVPVMEEIFWRGFLVRWLVDADFENVPVGRFTLLAFVATVAFFAGVHLRGELFASLSWGAGINVLCMATKNLSPCMVMHATTNLLLGVYVVREGAWSMW